MPDHLLSIRKANSLIEQGRDFLRTYGSTGTNPVWFRATQIYMIRVTELLGVSGTELDAYDRGIVTELGVILDAVNFARLGHDPQAGQWFQKAFQLFRKVGGGGVIDAVQGAGEAVETAVGGPGFGGRLINIGKLIVGVLIAIVVTGAVREIRK